eukprot:TRINITY_DN32313_c0_g1_i1.p1 TRINITY_DN32313_c0_g1~~TRINITY_DN32313_c0_g1_i1.p1  ORF type:complete len:279 (+),score=15.49 TRINITY_DN32313_c0_g1_i1:68-904(+)
MNSASRVWGASTAAFKDRCFSTRHYLSSAQLHISVYRPNASAWTTLSFPHTADPVRHQLRKGGLSGCHHLMDQSVLVDLEENPRAVQTLASNTATVREAPLPDLSSETESKLASEFGASLGISQTPSASAPEVADSSSGPPGPPDPSIQGSGKGEDGENEAGPVVQHIVLRKDLVETLKWPLGSVMAQGAHAAVAAIWLYREDQLVQRYCADLDHMHKVVLEVKGETQLLNLAEKLKAAGIAHKLWVEQPENIPTCLATKPYFKTEVAPHFKKLKLCK